MTSIVKVRAAAGAATGTAAAMQHPKPPAAITTAKMVAVKKAGAILTAGTSDRASFDELLATTATQKILLVKLV